MKKLVTVTTIFAAAFFSVLSFPLMAEGRHELQLVRVAADPTEKPFSIELQQHFINERVFVTIRNPGRKNLHVSLKGPDGFSIDDFFSGKKEDEINKIYNFSAADAGLYTLEVKCGKDKITKQIKLEQVITAAVTKLSVQ